MTVSSSAPETIAAPSPAGAGASGHAFALALGTVVAGLAAYGYIAIGTRQFGAEAFAPVAVIWSFWPAAAAAFALPLEQWIARELSPGGKGEPLVRAMLRRVLPAIGALCVLGGLACWIAGERLFGESGPLYAAVLAAVSAGAASMGVLRGGLAGRGRYLASATATALENLVRVAAGSLVLAVGWGLRSYAVILVLGPLVGLLWTSAFRFAAGRVDEAASPRGLVALAGGSLLAQIVLSAPPVLLAAITGPTAAVTASFAALALLRGPYLIMVGVSIRAVAPLTRALTVAGPGRVAVWLLRVAAVTVVAAAVVAPLSALVLPPILELIFGEGVVPSTAAIAGLAAGVVGAHGALAGSVIFLSAGWQSLLLRAWLVACAVNLVALALPIAAEVRVTVAFTAAELAAVLTMALLARRREGPSSTVPSVASRTV